MRRDSSAFQAETVEYRGTMAGLAPTAATAVMRRSVVPNWGSITVCARAGLARGVIERETLSFTSPWQRSAAPERDAAAAASGQSTARTQRRGGRFIDNPFPRRRAAPVTVRNRPQIASAARG